MFDISQDFEKATLDKDLETTRIARETKNKGRDRARSSGRTSKKKPRAK